MSNNIRNEILSVVLFEPRIPQNTGCIARTCAAFKFPLHLIEPLGFEISDKYLKRAGLDYWPYVDLHIHKSFAHYKNSLNQIPRIIGCSKSGETSLNDFKFLYGDTILLGREDNGLPSNIRDQCTSIISIPMAGSSDLNDGKGVRSLNLSVACGIITYQANLNINKTKN